MLFLCPLWPRVSLSQASWKISLPLPAVQVQPHSGRCKSCLIKRIAVEGEQTKISFFSSLKGDGKNWCAECNTAGISCILVLEMANSCFLYKNECWMLFFSFYSLCHVLHISVCVGCWCSSLFQTGPSTRQAGASGFMSTRSYWTSWWF